MAGKDEQDNPRGQMESLHRCRTIFYLQCFEQSKQG